MKIPNIDNRIRNMSGGQRQCVAIAAAAFASKLVIMDEPTAALGVQERGRSRTSIRRLKERGIPLILDHHNLRQVFDLVDKIWVFRRGRIAGMVETSKTHGNEVVSMITGVTSGAEQNARYCLSSKVRTDGADYLGPSIRSRRPGCRKSKPSSSSPGEGVARVPNYTEFLSSPVRDRDRPTSG